MAIEHAYHEYDQPDPPHQPLYLEKIIRHLSSDPSIARVLDAGCGDGNFTRSLATRGFEMFGVDASRGGIAKATSRYPCARFALGSVYSDLCAMFDVPSFDGVIAIEVIEHLYAPRRFVRRVYSALRPEGVFIVTTPYFGYLKNIALALCNRMDAALNPLWEGGHIKHWSYRTLRLMLEFEGFEFVNFEGAGRFPYLWSGMVLVARKPIQEHRLSATWRRQAERFRMLS